MTPPSTFGCPWLAGFLLMLAWAAPASDASWFARAWQSDEGLPDNTVVGVAQSADGFLWVATQSGLARFDGTRFREFAAATAAGLPTSSLDSLFLDRRDRLWIGKARGVLVCVDHGRTTAMTAHDGLPVLPVRMMAEVPGGALWVSYIGEGVIRILDGNVRAFTAQDGLPSGGTCQLVTDPSGRLWFAKANQLGVFRDGKFIKLLDIRAQRIAAARSGGVWICTGPQLFHYTEEGGLARVGEFSADRPKVNANVLYQDRAGAVWIGTLENGLFRYDGSTFASVKTSHHEILCVTEDREGNVWVGTSGGGLNRLQRRSMQLEDVGSGVSSEAVRSVCQDAAGDLWATTQTGALVRNEGAGWLNMSTNTGGPIQYAQCVAANPQGGVWVGTQYKSLFLWRDGVATNFSKADGIAGQSVRSLLSNPSGDLWLGTETPGALQRLREGRLKTFELPAGSGFITAMALDDSENLWAGTSKGLLLRCKEDSLSDETSKTLTPPEAIRCLCPVRDGSLWIGYGGGGAGRLKNGEFAQFGTQQGLHDDYVSHIVADQHGRLWFAGNRGIFYVTADQFDGLAEGRIARVRSIVYGGEEGLPNLQASHGFWPGVLQRTNGDLRIPTLTGLATLNVNRLKKHEEAPPVVIARVAVDGHTIAAYEGGDLSGGSNSPPRLPPDHQRVEFEFTALSFASPKNVVFNYKLEGLDSDWLDAGTERVVTYTHIRPGNYTFHVRACNEQGLWSPRDATFALTVLPHFWDTWTFRILASTGLCGILAGSVSWTIRRRHRRRIEQLERQRAMERERARIAQDLHDDLGAGLTEISFGSEFAQDPTLDLEETRKHTQEIGHRARELVATLDEIVWAVNPKNDTVASLTNYLCQFAERFLRPTRLRLRLKVARDLPESPLNAEERHNIFLAFKEALHNIVQHSRATDAHLTIEVEKGVLTVVVADNGCGFTSSANHSEADGLGNMRRRLERIGGVCELASGMEQGTRAIFKLPLREQPPAVQE